MQGTGAGISTDRCAPAGVDAPCPGVSPSHPEAAGDAGQASRGRIVRNGGRIGVNLRDLSLKWKLGLGAGGLAVVALAASAAMVAGVLATSQLIETGLAAERRLQRYSLLASEVSAFIAAGLEAARVDQAGPDAWARLDPFVARVRRSLAAVRSDLGEAVAAAEAMGFDEQTRRATRSLLVARMEASFESAVSRISDNQGVPLRPLIQQFSQSFDQLLGEAVAEELRSRRDVLATFEAMRERLILAAAVLAVLVLALGVLFHLAILRPQMRRLDALHDAAERIGRQDFSVAIPEYGADEIGRLARQTNATAAALAARKLEVETQAARLGEIIAEQTAELETKNRQLIEIDADRRRFFADVGHELRTPLTVILTEAEIGLKGGPAHEAFAAIRKRARALNRRMDDLLRIARSESGQLELEDAPFDLSQAAEHAVEETRGVVEQSGMALRADLAGPLPVRGDANWMRQVVASLVANAVLHAEGATGLQIETGVEAGQARLKVADDGPGLDPTAAAHAFERFARGDQTRRREGFGIGLSLAKWVVERQGGQIRLDSPAPGCAGTGPGLAVTIFMPMEDAAHVAETGAGGRG
jgi:signal transduction histidine kinase